MVEVCERLVVVAWVDVIIGMTVIIITIVVIPMTAVTVILVVAINSRC